METFPDGVYIPVYLYRFEDGTTQVRAPDTDDRELVIDILEEGLRCMSEGKTVEAQ